MNCFLHPEKPATDFLKIPCAPGGKIHICEECVSIMSTDQQAFISELWKVYKASHPKNIAVFKTPANPQN